MIEIGTAQVVIVASPITRAQLDALTAALTTFKGNHPEITTVTVKFDETSQL